MNSVIYANSEVIFYFYFFAPKIHSVPHNNLLYDFRRLGIQHIITGRLLLLYTFRSFLEACCIEISVWNFKNLFLCSTEKNNNMIWVVTRVNERIYNNYPYYNFFCCCLEVIWNWKSLEKWRREIEKYIH